MNELEAFDKVWNGHFHKTKFWGGDRLSRKGREHKERFENILFSIWKHHPDWEDARGFQLKCNFDSPSYRTLYRVRKLAEDAGLLVKVGNYYAGDHTNYYKKNLPLFDLVFRNEENKYGKWLEDSKSDVELDLVYKLLLEDFGRLNKENKYNLYDHTPANDTGKPKKRTRKPKGQNYDLEKLHSLTGRMFSHYYDLMARLNDAAKHHEMKLVSFIYLTPKGLPSGRPYSAFCSTLNPKKKHRDTSGEYRADFLSRIGLPDYHEVYDIKSEIPRVNYLFHTGEWTDDDYDFYAGILKHADLFYKPDVWDTSVSRGGGRFDDYNDSMKQLFMRIYFGKGTDLQSYNGYIQEREKRNERHNTLYDKGELDDSDLIDIMYRNKETLDLSVWKKICNSTREVCGKSIGPLVFWFSFFIETEVKIELLNRGKTVYNVYDGFYFNQDISSEISDILAEKAKYVYDTYMKPIRL